MKKRIRKKAQPANIFKGETEKVRMSDMLDNLNPGSWGHDKKLWVHRKMGVGISKPMKPITKKKILEKHLRLGTQTDMFGSSWIRKRAVLTFPKNRCARCTVMLSARHRHTIEVEGHQHDLTFCLNCATDLVRGS